LSDNFPRTYATLPQTVDGITIDAGTWAATAGDSFLIQPTRNGSSGLAVKITDPRAIAAAAPIRTAAALANTGTGSVSAGVVNAPPPTNADLQQTVTITFDNPPTTFGVVGTGTGNPANVVYTAGGSISYNGWTIQISGTPAAGDVFTLSSNSSGVSDNRNGVLLGGLQTRSMMEAGTATYQSSYSAIVSQIGNKAREVEITGKAQQTLYEQAETTRAQLSGVNLDEEAANLLRYQQAYQAAAKMMEVARTVFDEILALGR
jgi:flagellar hook-associated protein 1 FlgK